MTGSISGTIYVWDCLTWKTHFDHYPSNKKIKTLSLSFDEELNMLLYSTDDCRVKMVDGGTKDTILECWLDEYSVTALLICKKKKILFGGTSRGSIGDFNKSCSCGR